MGVFISHITPEASLAAVLKKWVEDAFLGQFDVFVSSDHDDITAGDQWFQKIEKALADAKVLLVICSTESVHRPWINFETGAGHMKEVPIIPICHTGMTKTELPKPLSFFQALDAEESDFEIKLMAALAKHLDFPREPRIPHQEMKEEVQDALEKIAKKSGNTSQQEEMGFIDHLSPCKIALKSLLLLFQHMARMLLTLLSRHATLSSRGMKPNQIVISGGSRKSLVRKRDAYAQKIDCLNEKYEKALPDTNKSLQYVIRFQSPRTDDDRSGIEGFLNALVSGEGSVLELKENAISATKTMKMIPNYQIDMNRAINKVIGQYETIISNLDDTLEMFQEARVYLNSLER